MENPNQYLYVVYTIYALLSNFWISRFTRSFAPPHGFSPSPRPTPPRPAGKSSAPHIPGRWVGIRWKGLGHTFQKIRTSLGQWKLCEGSVNYMKFHKDQHPTHKFSLSLRSYNSTEFVRLFIQSMFQIQTSCTVFNPFKQTPLVAFLANVICDSSPICCPFRFYQIFVWPGLVNICDPGCLLLQLIACFESPLFLFNTCCFASHTYWTCQTVRSAKQANIIFVADEVAIIEPGHQGSIFGKSWDFVPTGLTPPPIPPRTLGFPKS